MLRRIIALLAAVALLGAVPSAVTIDVDGAKLRDVIAMLAAQTHQNIAVDHRIEDVPVTMHLTGVSPQTALSAIEHAYGLAAVDNGSYTLLVPITTTATSGLSKSMEITTPNGQALIFQNQLSSTIPGLTATAVDNSTLLVIGPPDAISEAQDLVSQASSGIGYNTYSISYSSPEEMIAKLRNLGLLTNLTHYAADDHAGTITIAGPLAQRTAIASAITALDQAPRRLEFEVQVVAVQPYDESTNRGIVWGTAVNNQTTTSTNTSAQVTINQGSAITTFINGSIPIAAQIHQLASQGHAKVLATPSIAIDSSGKGQFISGENYPIETITTGLINGNNVQFFQIGTQLNLTAVLGKEGEVTSNVSAAYSYIESFDPITSLPIIANSSTTSDITIYPGESLVLAGFYQEQDTDIVTKVPGLGDIPILGQFFRDRQTTHQRSELAFIITPKPTEQKRIEQ